MGLAATVNKLVKPTPVTRRSLLVTGDDGRSDGSQTQVAAVVRLHLQQLTSRPTSLLRLADGDETTGDARLWVTDAALAAAYDVLDPGTPLGWTRLQIAPPEDADGPPGDWIDWQGIRYEITKWLGWAESFGGGAMFQRYECAQRGPTP